MKQCKEKMGKKASKKLFYKTNPYGGISLIVLVITIIVVIILAAAVIISLQNNNPMSEANRARYESDVANMQMIFTNTVGKIMAEKQEVVGIKECQINQITSGVKSTTGEVIYTINDEDAGKIIFTNEKSEEANNYITGKKLPIYSSQTKWNVDNDGILRLSVGKNTYPSVNSSGENGSGEGEIQNPEEDNVSISKEEYDRLKLTADKVSKIRSGTVTLGRIPANQYITVKVTLKEPMVDGNYSVTLNNVGAGICWAQTQYSVMEKTSAYFTIMAENAGGIQTDNMQVNYIIVPND